MDERIVRRVQDGDQEAFRALVVASHARLTRVAQGVLRDPHAAEDAVQQALLDIWRDIRRLRDPSRFEGWSYKLLLRVCYAEARRRPRWVPDDQVPPAAEPRVGDVCGIVVDRDQLSRGFAHLSPDHRAVIVLRYLMDLSPEQVAEALDIPRKTVYSRLGRAMDALRAALEAEARTPVPTPIRQEPA
ncbi:MAG: RNA polymerase sigma factor [Chloroflexota bacterium]